MKKRKSLVASLIAIILCFSMLLGTTYAWFTDSIINTNNIIKSGNVDVELYHTNTVVADEEVKENTKLFVNQNGGDILWEPSASTTETFTIKNAGSLALKYKFSVKALAKTLNSSQNSLLDVLTLTANGTPLAFDGELEGELVANDDVVYELKIVWNSTDNDNAYRNLQILLGVELVATQLASEFDGTGNEFDKDSQFPNLSTYVTIDKTSNEEVVLETKGENAVSANIPATLINALPENVTSISLAHTEPIETKDENNSANNSVYFKAIKLVDQDGKVIDLENLGINETITVTLPEQNVFAKDETVSIYHDGAFITMATVGDNGVITYTTSHFSEVQVKPASKWNGESDTSWYNETDTEFTLDSAEQIAGLAELVDSGNTFEGKTIILDSDLDLGVIGENGNNIGFNPIGHSSNGKSFNGTFDGQGHTISNMYEQSNLDDKNGGWLYEGEYYGLFAYTKGATIKNVTIADAYVSSGRNEAACVVGNAVDTVFSDINIKNSTLIAYNNSAGGVASECYGNCSFTNIVVDADTVIGPLWGTYDVRLGGIVGLVHAGNEVSFTNVKVACKLDAINDVAANYQYWLYRYCGMLIGHVDGVNGVADPTGYVTCENVEVTYGDWVNYHYCEDADLGAGSYNGPGEYKYARVEAGTGTDGIDLSNCNHNEDESHNVLIVFDQLFGGGQGVKGLKTYDGVTVVYPNEK